jgi:hypothetical protein
MEVFSRSYGSDSMIVNLGPQFVQFVNGYRYRRFFGSNTSAKHSGHVAMSGSTRVVFSPDSWLSRISNVENPTKSRNENSKL